MTRLALKRFKGETGKPIPGLWVGDVVRMEAVEGGWECQAPSREIGKTGFYEFRPLALGGDWQHIGTYRTREHGCIAAQRLQDGTHVLRGAHADSLGKVPPMVVEWVAVADEIAAHPSTH